MKTTFIKYCRMLIILCFTTILALCCLGCSLFGPPLPEQNAKNCLSKENVDDTLIQKLINRDKLEENEFSYFVQHKNDNVRFLLATNPYAPKNILLQLGKDHSNLVMQGITRNPQIPDELLNELLKNQSLLQYLVGNPRLSEIEIMKIYTQYKEIPLYYFAINPRCPPEVKKAIMKSEDSLAKRWIEINSQNTNRQKSLLIDSQNQ